MDLKSLTNIGEQQPTSNQQHQHQHQTVPQDEDDNDDAGRTLPPPITTSFTPSMPPTPLRNHDQPSEITAMSVDTSALADTSMLSHGSNSSSGRSSRSRVPLPSPVRPRIDPQYAVRLTPMSVSHKGTESPNHANSSLFLPPTINRESGKNTSIFRPTPIVTPGIKRPFDGIRDDTASSSFVVVSSPDRSVRSSSYSSLSPSTSAGYNSFGALTSPAGTPRRYTINSSSNNSNNNTTKHHNHVGQSDRFIPSRATSNFNFSLWDDSPSRANTSYSSTEDSNNASSNTSNTNEGANPEDDVGTTAGSTGDSATAAAAVGGSTATSTTTTRNSDMSSGIAQSADMLNVLLRSELLGENIDPAAPSIAPHQRLLGRNSQTPLRDGGNRFRFQSPRQAYHNSVFVYDRPSTSRTAVVDSFSLTPVGTAAGQRLLSTPQKRKRRIQKVPFKVLDAPALQDDFYLNLVDWSSQNVLAVGLGSCVYLWSACTSKVTKLCDLAQAEDVVTSVSWAQRGTYLAVGTNRGEVQLWDTVKCKEVRTMGGHSARIGTLSWSGPTLASGSRDRLIFLRDVRVQPQYTHRLSSHKQEVCGLKWSFDEPAMLASGGNDNKLLVWDVKNHTQPVHRFGEHTAAVKAIAWSPHQHGLLASGGGTADRCIRFWNTLSGVSLNCVDTGSQVCNLAWSHNCNEIVSTHGYSLNQIVVWRYPTMSKVVTLTGHTFRVLYLAMSPDGSTIVTGAGDETLRFWQVFPGPRSHDKSNANGLLFPALPGSVVR